LPAQRVARDATSDRICRTRTLETIIVAGLL
jgi:hypothetical protein